MILAGIVLAVGFGEDLSGFLVGLCGFLAFLLGDAVRWKQPEESRKRNRGVTPIGANTGESSLATISAWIVLFAGIWIASGLFFFTSGTLKKYRDPAIRFQYRGIQAEISAERPLRLAGAGESSRNTITWDPMGAGSELKIVPVNNEDEVHSWNIKGQNLNEVTRLNKRAVNLTLGGWIASDSVGTLTATMGRESFSFSIQTDKDSNVTVFKSDKGDGGARLRQRERKIRKNYEFLPLVRELLDDLTTKPSSTFITELERSISAIRIVRQTSDKLDSPIGLVRLGKDDSDSQLSLTVEGGRPEPRGAGGFLEIGAHNGSNVLEVGTQALSIQSVLGLAEGRTLLTLLFQQPMNYPLPEESRLGKDRTFLVTNAKWASALLASNPSINDQRSTAKPQYVLPSSGDSLQIAVYSLAPDLRSLTAKSLNADESETSSKKRIAVNEDVYLEPNGTSPIFRLSDPVVDHRSESVFTAILVVFASGLLALGITPHRTREESARYLLGPTIVWIMVTALFVVRAILAFRLTVLPPDNLPIPTLRMFSGAWLQSIQLTILFLFLSTFTYLYFSYRLFSREHGQNGSVKKFVVASVSNIVKVALPKKEEAKAPLRERRKHGVPATATAEPARTNSSGPPFYQEWLQGRSWGNALLASAVASALLNKLGSTDGPLRRMFSFFGSSPTLYITILLFLLGLLLYQPNSLIPGEDSNENPTGEERSGSSEGDRKLVTRIVTNLKQPRFNTIVTASLICAGLLQASGLFGFFALVPILLCLGIALIAPFRVSDMVATLVAGLGLVSFGIFQIASSHDAGLSWLIAGICVMLIVPLFSFLKSLKGGGFDITHVATSSGGISILFYIGLVILLSDLGGSVFLLAILIPFSAISIAKANMRESGRPGWTAILRGVQIVVVVLIALIPAYMGILAEVGPRSFLGRETLVPRLIASDEAATIRYATLKTGGLSEGQSRPLLNSMQQRWQMLESVTESGTGYLKSAMPSSGMKQAIIPTDAAFSSLIVAEHGRFAGWMLLVFLVLTGYFFIEGGKRHWASFAQRPYQLIGLYLIGSLILFVSSYMALANLWLLPFTGQNLPFFGVGSLNDGLFWLVISLIGIGMLLIHPGQEKAPEQPKGIWLTTPVIAALWVAVLAVTLYRHPKEPQAFELPAPIVAKLEGILNKVSRDDLTPDSVADSEESDGEISTARLKSSQAFLSEASPLFKFFAQNLVNGKPSPIQRGNSRNGLIVRPSELRLATLQPKTIRSWEGILRAVDERDSNRHYLVLSDNSLVELIPQGRNTKFKRFYLGREALVESSDHPDLSNPLQALRGSSVGRQFSRVEFEDSVQESEDERTGNRVSNRNRPRKYGGIRLDGDSVELEITQSGRAAQVLVDGEPVDPQGSIPLMPMQTVTFRPKRVGARSETMIYLGSRTPALSLSFWRNGKIERVYPYGSDFALAYSIAQPSAAQASIADRASAKKEKLDEVQISLNSALHLELQDTLRSNIPGRDIASANGGIDFVKFSCLSLIDTFSGKVVALPSFPSASPDEDAARVRTRFPKFAWGDTAQYSNWNLVASNIGSTMKPLVLSSMAISLEGSGFDFGTFAVNEVNSVQPGSSPQEFDKIGDLKLRRGFTPHQVARRSVDMAEFLRDSRTQPAVLLGFAGMTDTQASFSSLFVPGGSDVKRGGASYSIRFGSEGAGILNNLVSQGGNLSSMSPDRSLIMSGLQKLAEPYFRKTYESNRLAVQSAEDFETYLPKIKLTDEILSASGGRMLPDLHTFDATAIPDTSMLARYFFGGGESRWSSLMMAINMARMSSGKVVRPTFDPAAPESTTAMPAPLDTATWRNARLFEPLSHITTLGGFAAMQDLCRRHGYSLMVKTGTIEAPDNVSQTELVMFTVGARANGDWVPGRTYSGILNLVANRSAGVNSVRGEVFRAMLEKIIGFMDRGSGRVVNGERSPAGRRPVSRRRRI